MGIGLVLIVPQSEKEKIEKILESYPDYKIFEIGKITKGNGKVVLK